MSTRSKVILLKVIIHLCALLPVLYLYFQAVTDQLGADPVSAVIHFCGIGSFNLLLITLCVSPLAQWLKQGFLLQVRRLLGIYAFVYALLHVFNFLAFDLQFNITLFVNEVFKRPYITLGMLAFIIITILAVTSLNNIKRKLGKHWQRIHNLSYVLILLVAIHFYWSVKSALFTPSIYILLTMALLLLRYKKIKKLIYSAFV